MPELVKTPGVRRVLAQLEGGLDADRRADRGGEPAGGGVVVPPECPVRVQFRVVPPRAPDQILVKLVELPGPSVRMPENEPVSSVGEGRRELQRHRRAAQITQQGVGAVNRVGDRLQVKVKVVESAEINLPLRKSMPAEVELDNGELRLKGSGPSTTLRHHAVNDEAAYERVRRVQEHRSVTGHSVGNPHTVPGCHKLDRSTGHVGESTRMRNSSKGQVGCNRKGDSVRASESLGSGFGP